MQERNRSALRHSCAWLVWLVVLCGSARARADELFLPPLAAAAPERPTFEYTQPLRPAYLRASFEEVALLGLGFAQYVSNHDLNSVDWDFSYSWSGLRDKLSPRGYSFDTNGFDTNFIRHPAAGTTYYWAARSNRLTILESLVAATVASTFWEYIGELRELASVNDIVVTPLTGMVLGELTIQLGAFFDRSCDTAPNRVLGVLLGPIKSLHDALDGASPLREQRCDRYGLSQRGAHTFELSVAAGVVSTVAGPHVPVRPLTRLALHTQVIAVETYGTAGEGTHHFTDGNVSEFWLQGSYAETDWNDFTLRGVIMPLGLHYRALSAEHGLRGHELLFGLVIGTEYSVHRFGDWDGPTQLRDRYFELDVPGASVLFRRLWGDTKLTLELQAAGVFVGVDAIALPEMRERPAQPPLPAVARADGYNYVLGIRLQPRASLSYRNIQVGAELAAVRGSTITVSDRFEEREDYARGSERRTLAKLWIELGPDAWPLRLTLQGSWLQRWGTLGGVSAQRAELTAVAGLSLVF